MGKHGVNDLETGNVGGHVHVQEDRGIAEELLDADVEHHACRVLGATRGSGKIVEIVGPDPGADPRLSMIVDFQSTAFKSLGLQPRVV